MIKQHAREWWSDLRHLFNNLPKGLRKTLVFVFWLVFWVVVWVALSIWEPTGYEP